MDDVNDAGVRRACPVCTAPATAPLLPALRMPVFCNQLCQTRAGALEAPTAPVQLCHCRTCGHLFNAAFDPTLVEYGPEYENSLHHCDTFLAYARRLVHELDARYDLRGKQVVELGCGQGDFLRLLCAETSSRGVGFDPSYRGPDAGHPGEGIEIVAEVSTEQSLGALRPDFVCCRHVLEHVADPVAFLCEVHQACARPEGVPVFFEVPNGLHTLEHGGIWDIIYEHFSYFTPSSLRRAFQEAGFEELSIASAYGGQFLTMHARAYSKSKAHVPEERCATVADRSRGASFATRFHATVEAWSQRLRPISAGDVILWGAGSKGTTFVNVVPTRDAVGAFIDINPRKQGAFVPGSGHAILAPDQLRERSPKLVVVMNPVYEPEVVAQLAALGLAPPVVSASECQPPDRSHWAVQTRRRSRRNPRTRSTRPR